MKKRVAGVALILLLVVVALVLLDPLQRMKLSGLLHGEKFYRGLPAHYWRTAIEEGDGNERYNAILAVGRDPEWIPALTARLKDPVPLLRHLAAVELGRFGPQAKSAVPVLTELLHDEERSCREAAAEALAKIDPATTKPAP